MKDTNNLLCMAQEMKRQCNAEQRQYESAIEQMAEKRDTSAQMCLMLGEIEQVLQRSLKLEQQVEELRTAMALAEEEHRQDLEQQQQEHRKAVARLQADRDAAKADAYVMRVQLNTLLPILQERGIALPVPEGGTLVLGPVTNFSIDMYDNKIGG